MSRKRSISKKIDLKLNEFNFPSPETTTNKLTNEMCLQKEGLYFGEHVKTQNCCNAVEDDIFSSNSSNFEIRDELSCTGSSVSGDDDIEIEATKNVANEFERLDRIFFEENKSAISQVASKAEKDEFQLWTKQFPHLRIIGTAMKIHPCPKEHIEECNEEGQGDYFEEVIAEHYDSDYEISTKNSTENKKKPDNLTRIKETVINSIIEEIKSKLYKETDSCQILTLSSETPTEEENLDRKTNSFSMNVSECNGLPTTSENYLLISPMPVHNSPFRQYNVEYQSPIMRSHLSASKWQRDDPLKSSSLPYISNSSVPYRKNMSRNSGTLSANKSDLNLAYNSSASSRRKFENHVGKIHSKSTNSPRVKNCTLPPIQNLSLDVDKEKSVLSTPKRSNSRPVSNKFKGGSNF